MRFRTAVTRFATPVVLALAANSASLAAGPITSGQLLAGSISGPSYSEVWTFSGTAGNRVLIAAVTTSGALNTVIRLSNPASTEVVNTSADFVDYQLLSSGTYTLTIEDSGLNDAGSYSLSLLNVTAGPLTTGSDLDGGAITSAEVRTGQMNGVTDFDAFTFSGTAGDRIEIAGVATGGVSFNTDLTLYPPGGGAAEVNTVTGDRIDTQLAVSGTYTVVVNDYTHVQTGTYSLSLLNLTAGPLTSGTDLDGGTIASGEVKAGQLQTVPDFDAYRFTANAGDRVLIGAITTGGTMNSEVYLYPPGGGAALVATSADRVDYQLPLSGTYAILIEEVGTNDTGNYNLSFLNLTGGPLTTVADSDGGPLPPVNAISGQTNLVGDFDAFTFDGSVGDHMVIGAIATGGSSYNTNITLYPPGGGAAEANSVTGDRMDVALAASGRYSIVIEDYSTARTGSYTLQYVNLSRGPINSDTDPDGGDITSASVVSGALQSSPDFDVYRFAGNVGDRVLLAAIATGGTVNTQISLYAPWSASAVVYTSADRVEIQLPATGTYNLLIEDAGLNDTGTYNLSYLNLTSGPLTNGADTDGGAIASATVKSGQINLVGDFDAFTFSGAAGDRILFGAIATGGTSFNTNITLYPPGGGAAEVNTVTGDRLDAQLAVSGTYTAVVEDYSDTHTGTYSLTLLNLTAGPLTSGTDADGGTINSADVLSGQAQTAPDFDAYRVIGNLGDRILIAAVSTGGTMNTQVYVYPPGNGAPIVVTSSDRTEVQLLASGVYTILIEDVGLNDTGTYNLSYLNLTTGPLLNGTDTDGGAIASAAVKSGQTNVVGDFDAFTFSGVAGDRILFGAIATGGASFNTNLTLYPPGGGAAEVNTVTGDRLDAQLTVSGTYTAVVEDYSDSHTGTYSLTLLNLTAGPLTSGTDPDGGTLQPSDLRLGQMQTAPDFDAFRFAGAFGDTVRVTATTTLGTMNTEAYIYPPTGGAVVATSSDNITYVLTSTGIHTLLMQDVGLNDTGSYSISFLKSGGVTGVEDALDPARVLFLPVSPNPFSGPVQLVFSLPGENWVRLRVFDLHGALVRTVLDQRLQAGRYARSWDGRDRQGAMVASGVYYAELRVGAKVMTRKMVRMR